LVDTDALLVDECLWMLVFLASGGVYALGGSAGVDVAGNDHDGRRHRLQRGFYTFLLFTICRCVQCWTQRDTWDDAISEACRWYRRDTRGGAQVSPTIDAAEPTESNPMVTVAIASCEMREGWTSAAQQQSPNPETCRDRANELEQGEDDNQQALRQNR
jgi:hypothetical protein